MKWRTCFSSISYAGYKLDILKSALQKYLRRREFEKMLWCCSEIYMFHSLAMTDKEKQLEYTLAEHRYEAMRAQLDLTGDVDLDYWYGT